MREKAEALLSLPKRLGARGETVLVLPQIDSTNTELRRRLQSGALPRGQVLIAMEQSGGRGRQGNGFVSGRGGLYLSYYLPLSRPAQDCTALTCAAGVCVLHAVARVCGAHAGIKWVNDPVLDGKKICGILTERMPDPVQAPLSRLIIGIGINVSSAPFSGELALRATTLEQQGYSCALTTLAETLIRELDEMARRFEEGKEAVYFPEYRQHCVTLGKEIRILSYHGAAEKTARAIGLTEDYGLRVVFPDGAEDVLRSGEVRVRGLDGYVGEAPKGR